MTKPNFPNSPSPGDTYTVNGITYIYKGGKWEANNYKDTNGFVAKAGDTMAGDLTVPNLESTGSITAANTEINPIFIRHASSSPDKPNFYLNAGGSFSGIQRLGFGISDQLSPSGKDDLNIFYDIGTKELNTDGSITAAGRIISGSDPSDGSTGAVLKDTGTVSASRATGTSAIWEGYNGSATSTSRINADGSSAFTGRVDVPELKAAGSGDTQIFGGYQGGTRTSWIKADGKASFQSTSGFNVFIELEPDNPANYVSTTNADGETEAVYNGPSLNVKALLLEFQTKIQTLEAAKSALETRLAAVEADHQNMNMNNNNSGY